MAKKKIPARGPRLNSSDPVPGRPGLRMNMLTLEAQKKLCETFTGFETVMRYHSVEAVQVLVRAMDMPIDPDTEKPYRPDKAAMIAATEFLNRAWGTPRPTPLQPGDEPEAIAVRIVGGLPD